MISSCAAGVGHCRLAWMLDKRSLVSGLAANKCEGLRPSCLDVWSGRPGHGQEHAFKDVQRMRCLSVVMPCSPARTAEAGIVRREGP